MRISSTTAFASRQGTVSNTVLSLVDFGFSEQQVQQAERMFLLVNTNSIRCWWDSSTPTTTTGAVFSVGLEIVGDNIRNFKMICNGSTDSEVAILLES